MDDPSTASAISHDVSARAGERARWIATLLEGIESQDPATPGVVSFLNSYADTVAAFAPIRPLDTPLDWLARRFELTATEVEILLLAGLPEEHEGLARTFRALHPLGEPHVSVGLLAQLLCPGHDERAALEAVLLGGAAAGGGLFRIAGPGTFYERSIVLADSLWGALHGHDGSWPTSLLRVGLDAAPPGIEYWVELPAVDEALELLADDDDGLVVLVSGDETVALSRLAALASTGLRLLTCRVPLQDRELLRLAAVHAAVRGACLALLPADGPGANEENRRDAQVLAPDIAGPVLLVTTEGSIRPAPDRPIHRIDVGTAPISARREAWRRGLPTDTDQAAQLAARHPVDPAIVAAVCRDLRPGTHVGCELPLDQGRIAEAIRTRIGFALPAGAALLHPRATWDRLVLAEEATQILCEVTGRMRHQSTVLDDWHFLDVARATRGARLLFTGPPGTGKSLAAEVVAHELEVDVLAVDLSQVVSKWLGETEKNLAKLFDAAERSLAVLRFDEADALFAARTSISDANDRYANLETAYLLQRLDQFEGLAILTTNLKQNVDRAFLRRMDAVVEFGLPDETARRRLWEVHLPAGAPVDPGLDLDELAAAFEVPGAWIRNALIAAAFLAAAADRPIDQRHLRTALRREYQKAARPFPGDLGSD